MQKGPRLNCAGTIMRLSRASCGATAPARACIRMSPCPSTESCRWLHARIGTPARTSGHRSSGASGPDVRRMQCHRSAARWSSSELRQSSSASPSRSSGSLERRASSNGADRGRPRGKVDGRQNASFPESHPRANRQSSADLLFEAPPYSGHQQQWRGNQCRSHERVRNHFRSPSACLMCVLITFTTDRSSEQSGASSWSLSISSRPAIILARACANVTGAI